MCCRRFPRLMTWRHGGTEYPLGREAFWSAAAHCRFARTLMFKPAAKFDRTALCPAIQLHFERSSVLQFFYKLFNPL